MVLNIVGIRTITGSYSLLDNRSMLPLKSVKNARLFIVILLPAGKHLKRGHAVRILIAGSVKFIVLSKTT